MEKEMTHKQAIYRISNWMRMTKGFVVVLSEPKTGAGEIPDVIGWTYHGFSTMVECKVSRADFLKDKKKIFRYYENEGVGGVRLFAAPKGLLNKSDIPEGWGLLEITRAQIREVVEPEYKKPNKDRELKLLLSAMRRLEISTAVFVRQESEINES